MVTPERCLERVRRAVVPTPTPPSEGNMKFSGVFFRTVALAAALGFAAACSDDDDNGPSEPATPAGLAAVLQDDGSIEVTWDAVDDATSYVLQRNADGGAFTQVGGSL